jgi:hypothetical protein
VNHHLIVAFQCAPHAKRGEIHQLTSVDKLPNILCARRQREGVVHSMEPMNAIERCGRQRRLWRASLLECIGLPQTLSKSAVAEVAEAISQGGSIQKHEERRCAGEKRLGRWVARLSVSYMAWAAAGVWYTCDVPGVAGMA